MLTAYQKFCILFIIILWGGGFLCSSSFASGSSVKLSGSSVKLIVNPNKTDIWVGSEPIAITAKVSGTSLKYTWELLGPGNLEGEGSAVFYIPPEMIAGELTMAMITVHVTDDSGQIDMASVTFQIISKQAIPTLPTPTPTPAPKRLDLLTLEEASKEKLVQLQQTLSQQYQNYKEFKKKKQQGEDVDQELSTALKNLVEDLKEVNTIIKVISSESPESSFQQFMLKLTSLLAQSEEIKNGRQPLVLEEFFTDLSKIIQITDLYQQVLEKLEALTPGKTIELRMGTEKDQYEFGDPFELRFWVSQDCYVVLMDISRSQLETTRITFLLPNGQFPDNKIKGSNVYSTVHDFGMNMKVAPPEGVDTINLFCSIEKIDLFKADFKKEPYYTIKSYDEDRLKKLLESLDRLKNYEWSGGSVMIRISSGGRSLSIGPTGTTGKLPPIGATGTTGKFFPPIGATGTTGKSP